MREAQTLPPLAGAPANRLKACYAATHRIFPVDIGCYRARKARVTFDDHRRRTILAERGVTATARKVCFCRLREMHMSR